MEGDTRCREVASRGPCAGIRRKIRPTFFRRWLQVTMGVNKRRQNRQRAGLAPDETLHAARRETVKDIRLPVLWAFFILMRGSICRFACFFYSLFFCCSFLPALQMWLILPDDTHGSGVKGNGGKRRRSLLVLCQGLILSQIRSVQWCSFARLITQAGLAEVLWTL